VKDVVATALALTGSLVVIEVARRTPASLPLTGRPRRRTEKDNGQGRLPAGRDRTVPEGVT
jgi:hypothetical protein